MTNLTDLLRVDGTQGEQELLKTILAGMCRTLGLPCACIALYSGARVEILAMHGDGIDGGVFGPDAVTFLQMLRDGEVPQLMPNTMMDPVARHLRWMQRIPIGATACFPLHTNSGQTVGAICCFASHPSVIHARELKLAMVLSRIAANVVSAPQHDANRLSNLRQRIRNVVNDAKVDIHLQPIVNLATKEIRGYEALSRFQDDSYTGAPRQWFKDARRVGMQPLLECTAIAQAVELLNFLPQDTYLSINSSPQTVEIGAVADILLDSSPDRIVLDLSDWSGTEHLHKLDIALCELRGMGVQIALDNVGSDIMQLDTIERIKPDILKLDLSVVKSINRREESQILTQAIVQLAQDLDSVLIAVGIEHESERATLAELGVTFGHALTPRSARNLRFWLELPQLLQSRIAQTGEIFARMIGRARQRRGRDHQEPLAIGRFLVGLKLFRRHKPIHRMVLWRRLQILPDG